MFPNEAVVRHAKQAQIDHWAMIAVADFDDTYLQSVTRIGQTHNRLGLEPRWYIAGYSIDRDRAAARDRDGGCAHGSVGGTRGAGKEGRAACAPSRARRCSTWI